MIYWVTPPECQGGELYKVLQKEQKKSVQKVSVILLTQILMFLPSDPVQQQNSRASLVRSVLKALLKPGTLLKPGSNTTS